MIIYYFTLEIFPHISTIKLLMLKGKKNIQLTTYMYSTVEKKSKHK